MTADSQPGFPPKIKGVDQTKQLLLDAIELPMQKRKIESSNKEEILNNLRGMFQNKLLLTSDRLEKIIDMMCYHYLKYREHNKNPVDIDIWIRLFTKMCADRVDNIKDNEILKYIGDFYNDCYKHNVDPEYVMRMQKGLGMPDFTKIDKLVDFCIGERISYKSIMKLREGKGVPDIEKAGLCINAFRRKYSVIILNIREISTKYILGQKMDEYEERIWNDFAARILSCPNMNIIDRNYIFNIKEFKRLEVFEKFQQIVQEAGIVTSRDYRSRSPQKGWPGINTLTQSPHFKNWDEFLGREKRKNWSEKINTKEGLEEFQQIVQEAGIKSSSDYRNEYTKRGWPAVSTLIGSDYFPRKEDEKGNKINNWDKFLGRKNNYSS